MPIFEYQCTSCNNQYEALIMDVAEEDLPKCPKCGGSDVKKLLSPVSVLRSPSQRNADRSRSLVNVDPTKPQEVARHLKTHGSRFNDAGFRGKKAWHDAVDRVSRGGPTLEK
ncbi:zinc ribbon domain-containing protein [Thermodesulfobacteriota bacterium]